ncbi:MAG: enoyl-CoA hydratase/isomerase family protein [Gammaproteobacteria bacterium]|nr:enoyl-CoA hydratase/isomerase family protein [Gammaproteobacteria bacterium]
MKKYQTLRYSVGNGICTIRLDRPESLNAMNRQLVRETGAAFEQANHDDRVNVIVFTGTGRAFCAGDDRREHVHPENEAAARRWVESIQKVTREIVLGEKLVVGAINGWAVGGGFEWAVNCDFPIWARSAKGFFPEVSLNLFVTGGVTSLLPALAGLNRAREMLLLGERYSTKELLDMQVAWRVVEDARLLDEANRVARHLAGLPRLSSRAMKRVLNQTVLNNLRHALDLETEATTLGFLDPETTRRLKDFS